MILDYAVSCSEEWASDQQQLIPKTKQNKKNMKHEGLKDGLHTSTAWDLQD